MPNLTSRVAFGFIFLTAWNPTWSDSEGYYFDCDVPSGNFSEWHGPIEHAETVRVSGTVEVVVLRHDKRWWPIGSVFLNNPSGESIGLQVYVDWRDTDTFLLGLYSGERIELAEIPLTDEPIPFEFSLNGFRLRRVDLIKPA